MYISVDERVVPHQPGNASFWRLILALILMWAIGVSGTVLLFVVASVGKTHDGVATELSFTACKLHQLGCLYN